MNELNQFIKLMLEFSIKANKKNVHQDGTSKSRGYMSGRDVTWTGEDTNEHLHNWYKSMGLMESVLFEINKELGRRDHKKFYEDIDEAEKRKPRKKGQHTGSPNHSDLYTNEREEGTIRGLGFKDAATARKGVATVNKAKRTHAHKVQATLVMKQRAKVAKERAKDPEKKKNLNSAYKIWSDHLEKLKKKTKKMNEELLRKFVRGLIQEVGGHIPANKWVLLQSGDPRRELVKQNLFDLVQQTYEPIGGHFKITSPDSLDRYSYWVVKDIDQDPDIDVAILAKPDIGGAKMGAAANDGSALAASEYKNKSAELRAGGSIGGVSNWWGEVSGKPAYAMLSRGAAAIEDEAKVAQLLAGDDYVFHGAHPDPNAPALFKSVNGWYTRRFGSKSSTKIILGNPS